MIFDLRNDPSPQVRLQVAIAAAKQDSIPTIPTLVAVLAQAGDDPLAPRIVWQNLHPLLETQTAEFVAEIQKRLPMDQTFPKPVLDLLPRAADRILSTPKPDTGAVAELREVAAATQKPQTKPPTVVCSCLTARIRSGEITGDTLLQDSQAT